MVRSVFPRAVLAWTTGAVAAVSTAGGLAALAVTSWRFPPGCSRRVVLADTARAMKVFVTGGTGVAGRPSLPLLVAAGHDVVAVARSTARRQMSPPREPGRCSSRRTTPTRSPSR